MLSPLSNKLPTAAKLAPPPISEGPHIGVDEAGRGCLAGPVVAAAVLFPPNFDFATLIPGLNDSKKLTEKRRNLIAPLISKYSIVYGIGLSWQDEIDRINILNGTFRAMSRALLSMSAKLQAASSPIGPNLLPLLLDGNQTIPITEWQACIRGIPVSALAWEQYLPLPDTKLPPRIPTLPAQSAVIGADALFPAVSAASILAKTFRDGIMTRLDEFEPGYGFAIHKGYATKEHLYALAQKGPCQLHRKTFKKVRPEDVQLSLL